MSTGSNLVVTSGSYAPVHGLQMYYELHGAGMPLVLLHGALSGIDSSFGTLLPELARTRQVIAVELQGHGRTADLDRPLSYEGLADDVARLLRHLEVPGADVFGTAWGLGSRCNWPCGIRTPCGSWCSPR